MGLPSWYSSRLREHFSQLPSHTHGPDHIDGSTTSISCTKLTDSMIDEWKIIGGVSAFLATAAFSTLQAFSSLTDPITRTALLVTIVLASISVSCGSGLALFFLSTKGSRRQEKWAKKLASSRQHRCSYASLTLAIPAIFSAWACLASILSAILFIWRSGQFASSTAVFATLFFGVSLLPLAMVGRMAVIG